MTKINFERYIGIPFVDGGRDFNGADCIGVADLFYRTELNQKLPEFKIAAKNVLRANKRFREEERSGLWEKLEKPEPYCLIAMTTDEDCPTLVNHWGVYIGNNKFLHTFEGTASVIQDVTNLYWKRCIRGFYRYKGESGG
jgi:cell wall-associated NlpC family hydrolase